MNPISNDEIEKLLRADFKDANIAVEGDGYQYRVTIVSDLFSGKSTVQRHKQVYRTLNDVISGGVLHALSLVTLTPDEKRLED